MGPAQGQGQPPAPVVTAETVSARSLELTSTLPGRVVASRVAEVRPQVGGIITERLYEEGDRVEAGTPLFQIQDTIYLVELNRARASLRRAEANMKAAKARAARYADLVKTGGVSQQEYDDAIAASEQASAEVGLAEAERDNALIAVDRTVIKAPIAGFVGRSLVTEGALVTANQPEALTTVTTLDPIYVDLTQSSDSLLRWKRQISGGKLNLSDDQKLPVRLQLGDGMTYDKIGELTLAEVNVDPNAGSVTLRAVFDNPNEILLPGMFVRAEIEEGVRDDAVLVSQSVVSRKPNGDGVVYVIADDGTAQERLVVTERAIGNQWLVTGVEPGTRVVTSGFQYFQPGQMVKVQETVANNEPSDTGGGAAPGSAR